MNKRIIIVIGLCLLASLAGLIITTVDESIDWGYRMINIGLGLGQLLGLMMMISNGTIKGTTYWRIIVAFLAVTVFGIILKVLHYPYADQSLFVGCLGIATTYLVWFIAKKKKGHLDFLKVLWVLSANIAGVLIVLHIIPREFKYLIYGTFWILLLDFIWLEFRTKGAN